MDLPEVDKFYEFLSDNKDKYLVTTPKLELAKVHWPMEKKDVELLLQRVWEGCTHDSFNAAMLLIRAYHDWLKSL